MVFNHFELASLFEDGSVKSVVACLRFHEGRQTMELSDADEEEEEDEEGEDHNQTHQRQGAGVADR